MTSGREHNKTGTLDPGDPDNDDVWRTYSTTKTIPLGRWFTLEAIADGNILSILLDGKLTAYHVDHKRRYVSGHIALEQHDPQTVIEFRKIEIRELNRPGPERPQGDPTLHRASYSGDTRGLLPRRPHDPLRRR